MCSNPKSPFLAYENTEAHTLFWFRADCKLWTCSDCAKQMKTRVAARAGRGADDLINSGLTVHHITITANRHWRGQARSIANFRANWPKLRKRATYYCPHFAYAVFAEHHTQDDSMHVHMLAATTMSERWWKDNAASSGLGYQAKARPVAHGGEAARYATKYISKSLEVEKWPKGFHRIRFSKRWPQFDVNEFSSTVDWHVFTSIAGFNDEVRYWQRLGYKIVNTRDGEIQNA